MPTSLIHSHYQNQFRPHAPSLPLWLLAMTALAFATSGSHDLNQLERIRASGSLVMLTVNGATTYFLGPEGETGFEYDLAQAFSKRLGIPLEVVVLPSIGELPKALERGSGDFIAANLSRTVDRQARWRFGPVYEPVSPVVVYRRGNPRPDGLADLHAGRLGILPETSYEEYLQDNAPGLNWTVHEQSSIEDLFDLIAREELDYTIVDSNILELNRRFFPNIRPAFKLDQDEELAWATVREDDDTLAQKMREFFAQASDSGLLTEVRQRHYDHVESFEPVGTITFMQQVRRRLPELLPHFEQAALDSGLDWRLLAAVGYQESHWEPDAVSVTGVRGIMMLTQRTARQVGVSDRRDPQQSINGGARYLKSILERLPERIEHPDRLWLGLAAYNVGFGHLEDARVLTQRLGGDPDRWLDVREHLPLLTQERWYRQTRFGYARGYEPVNYVENVRTFYDILVWLDGRDHPLLADRREAAAP